MKRALSILLATLFLLTALPMGAISVSAATSGTTGDLTWIREDGHLTIFGNGEMGNFFPIEGSAGVYWTSAPWGAAISSVTIREGVTSIGDYAFYGLPNLRSVTIPNSVATIGTYAFKDCDSLKTVYYHGTPQDEMAISVGSNNSPLTAATWHYFTDAYDSTCNECDSVRELDLPATSGTTGQCTWTLDGTHLTISGNGRMRDYTYDSLLPWGTNITSVTIDEGVTTIGDYAFYKCASLTTVSIPDSVTSIGKCAFENCASLTTGTIPDSVTTIKDYAFRYCSSLTAVSIGDSVTTIGHGAFFNCTSLTMETLGDSVTTIGDSAFAGCISLTSVIMPNGATTIGDMAFYSCKSLTTVTIPNSITTIGKWAFDLCNSLTDVYYVGSEVDRAAISCNGDNSILQNATWHYLSAICDAITFNGNSISEDASGLAFRFDVACKGVTVNGTTAIYDNVDIDGYRLISMGAVVANDISQLDIPAVYLCDLESDSAGFAVRVKNIPADKYDAPITATPYIVLEIDGVATTIYGEAQTCSYNDVKN